MSRIVLGASLLALIALVAWFKLRPEAVDGASSLSFEQCEAGDAEACLAWADADDARHPVSQNMLRRLRALEQACRLTARRANCDRYRELRNETMSAHLRLSEAQTACDDGSAVDCWLLSRVHRDRSGNSFNPAHARLYSERACELGNAEACTAIGREHARGEHGRPDPYEAAEYYEIGCSRGDHAGCALLSAAFREGEGVQQSYERSRFYRLRECEAGDPQSCRMLGEDLFRGNEDGHPWSVQRNVPEAVQLLRRACLGHDGQGCLLLGFILEDGNGVDQDLVGAAQYYRLACDAEMLPGLGGCAELGEAYLTGAGVERNLAEAEALLLLDCQNVGVCDGLGDLYLTTDYEGYDKARALDVFIQSCLGDEGQGCRRANELMQANELDAETYRRAVETMAQYCGTGRIRLGRICRLIGRAYAFGRGVPQDQDIAEAYFAAAADADERGRISVAPNVDSLTGSGE